jgi:hypothetical protein
MMEALDTGVVETHVVGCPARAERLAVLCQLADEIGKIAVVRVTAHGPAQDRNALAGNALPVDAVAPLAPREGSPTSSLRGIPISGHAT